MLVVSLLLGAAIAAAIAVGGFGVIAGVLLVVVVVASLWLARRVSSALENVFGRQDRLLRAAAHELYSPLGWLKASIEEGLTGTRTEAEALSEADDAADDLHQLIADLVEVANLISGSGTLPDEQVDLAEVASEVAARGTDTDAVVEVKVDGEPPEITGSAPLLRRAVSNLVRNAARHGYGGGAGTITIGVRDTVITVADTGVGVDAAQLARLRRDVPLGISIEPGGSRLGLALVGWVAAVHGGVVTLEPNEPQGFRVILDLPQPGKGLS